MIAWYEISAATAPPQSSLSLECLWLQNVSLDCLSFHLPFPSWSVEFREPRVIELWEAAKRTNLSNDELESLKVVLTSLVTVFMFLDTLLPCLFLNDTFCFNVVLQSNFDSNSTKLFNRALFWHRSINCIIFHYLVAKYYLCTVSHGKCNFMYCTFEIHKYSTLLDLVVLLSPFVPLGSRLQWTTQFKCFGVSIRFQDQIYHRKHSAWISSVALNFYLPLEIHISYLFSCACNWRLTELTPLYVGCSYSIRRSYVTLRLR